MADMKCNQCKNVFKCPAERQPVSQLVTQSVSQSVSQPSSHLSNHPD